MTWQPIATAPKDGTVILITKGGEVMAGWWSDEPETRTRYGHFPWVFVEDQMQFDGEGTEAANVAVVQPNGLPGDDGGPTHWHPLPPPPSPTSDTAASPLAREPNDAR